MSAVLDIVEKLLNAANHPDIVNVAQYGPGDGPWGPSVKSPGMDKRRISGVRVTHQSTSSASLWEAIWPGETPVEAPAVLPLPKGNRAPRLLILTAQLLDVARPAQFQAWRLVALAGLSDPQTQAGLPFGLSILGADGERWLLRGSATGVRVGQEPDEDPFPDYVIPVEQVRAAFA